MEGYELFGQKGICRNPGRGTKEFLLNIITGENGGWSEMNFFDEMEWNLFRRPTISSRDLTLKHLGEKKKSNAFQLVVGTS